MTKLFRQARKSESFVLPMLNGVMQSKEGVAIIDLRQDSDFGQSRLPSSTNVPIAKPGVKSPFSDPSRLSEIWTKLENLFNDPSEALKQAISGKRVLVVCYDGDSARVAASVMRAKGHSADSLRGGISGLTSFISCPTASDSDSSPLSAPSWLQLCEAQDRPSQVGGTTSPATSKLLSLHHPAVRA